MSCSDLTNNGWIDTPLWGLIHGSSTSSCWENMCCGDDENEIAREYCYLTQDLSQRICTETGGACCDEPGLCAYDGVCYGNPGYNTVHKIGGESTLCTGGYNWVDCDSFNPISPNQPALCEGSCGFHWVKGGESSAFGEYDSGTATECCGDDSGEYYAPLCPGVTGKSSLCCNDFSDCVTSTGICCVQEYESCDVNEDCCGYDGTVDGALCVGGECRKTEVTHPCSPWDGCSPWLVGCVYGNEACCPTEYGNAGEGDPIETSEILPIEIIKYS